MVNNDGIKYGQDFEKLCEKISKKKQGSKSFKNSLKERDDYINKVVKDIDLSETGIIYIEKLKDVKYKSKIGRKVMNKPQRWSYKKVIFRLELICEETYVQLLQVNPENTSRTCVNCGTIDAKSRNGEIFRCVE